MAIYRNIFKKQGNNTAAITAGATTADRWAGRLRVRMTEQEEFRYGSCNVLRIVNKSTKKARIHFTWSISNERYEDIEANSIRNITVDDGISFYGFDIENLDAANDIAAGDLHYSMSVVKQEGE